MGAALVAGLLDAGIGSRSRWPSRRPIPVGAECSRRARGGSGRSERAVGRGRCRRRHRRGQARRRRRGARVGAVRRCGEDALVVSIAAGVTIAELEAAVPGRPVVRAMPNTPALVREGVAAIAAGHPRDRRPSGAAPAGCWARWEPSSWLPETAARRGDRSLRFRPGVRVPARRGHDRGRRAQRSAARRRPPPSCTATIRGAGVLLTESGETAETTPGRGDLARGHDRGGSSGAGGGLDPGRGPGRGDVGDPALARARRAGLTTISASRDESRPSRTERSSDSTVTGVTAPGCVSFLSDYGHADEFVGVCKAVMLGLAPDSRSSTSPTTSRRTTCAPAPSRSCRAVQYLPDGIVLAVVDPGVGTDRALVAVETESGILLGPDNGLLAPAVAMVGGAQRVVSLTNDEYQLAAPGPTFAGRDVLAPAAGFLARGVAARRAGRGDRSGRADPRPVRCPTSRTASVVGEVWWVDRYGNCQLNIGPDELGAVGAGPGEPRRGPVRRHRPPGAVGAHLRRREAVGAGAARRLLRTAVGGAGPAVRPRRIAACTPGPQSRSFPPEEAHETRNHDRDRRPVGVDPRRGPAAVRGAPQPVARDTMQQGSGARTDQSTRYRPWR